MSEKIGLDPCNFCLEQEVSDSEKSLCFISSESFFALPTLGCFVPGYSLVVPRMHIRSFAKVSDEKLIELDNFLELVRKMTEREFGPVLVAEHGTGDDEISAACCDHAHIHIIPIKGFRQEILEKYIRAGGTPIRLESLKAIKQYNLESYILASFEKGEFLLWDSSKKFQRQFARIASAECLNLGHVYNWRIHPFPNNMVITTAKMSCTEGGHDPQ